MTRREGKGESITQPSAAADTARDLNPPNQGAAGRAALSIRASSKEEFDALLKVVTASAAEPASFATPIDATEDQESYTLAFNVRGHDQQQLTIVGHEQSLVIWGARRSGQGLARRVCPLGEPINPDSLQMERAEEVLRVRVLKKRPSHVSGGATTPEQR